MTNEILKINDLNKSFAKRKVINKLDLTVSRGDIWIYWSEWSRKNDDNQNDYGSSFP